MDSSADHSDHKRSEGDQSTDYAPYPTLTAEDVAPPPPPSVASGHRHAASMPANYNPYVTSSPASKSTADTVREALGKLGKKVSEAAKKTEGLAGDVWQHLKTGPSVADAAMGRIGQISKVIAEGGYEKVFQQSFEILPEEKLKTTYACYLSTSAGPVMGVLYLSTAKLAFCSDNPLSYKVGDKTEWSYYKEDPLSAGQTTNIAANMEVKVKEVNGKGIDAEEPSGSLQQWPIGHVLLDRQRADPSEALVQPRPSDGRHKAEECAYDRSVIGRKQTIETCLHAEKQPSPAERRNT